MCGIAGIIGKGGDKALIKKMTEQIIHRGPDEDGFYVDNEVALGMRRLSIIDLKTGGQPIASKNGNKLIFFNGEIYNYKDLREQLVEKGYEFKTKTDTEVVLHLYEDEGEKMLLKLRGMFSFCIYDCENRLLFLARDYFGIKPLYYFKKEGRILAFASEIKSLLCHPEYKKEVNDEAIFNYLSFQYNPMAETAFKNIYKLPPAHFLKIDLKNNNIEVKRYWAFRFNQDEGMEEGRAARELLEKLKDSVKHHMVSDVPVGAFLSGGIDSGTIATLMQTISGAKKISTFTIGFKNFGEGEEAKITSDYLKTDHNEIKVSAYDYFKALPKIVWHFDEPVADPSAAALYFVAWKASKKVKVVLSGEGADELFGGYNIYLEPFSRRKLSLIPKFLRDIIFRPLYKSDLNFRGKNYLRRFFSELEDWYIGNACVFDKNEIKRLWKGRAFESFSLKPYYDSARSLSDSTKMQFIDINTWLAGDILAKADKMTMANSLELRVPFLDVKIAEFASSLPDRLKFKGRVTKYLLRQAVKNILPEPTRKRRKLGFPTPIHAWLREEQAAGVFGQIRESDYIRKNMDLDYINQIIGEHVSGKKDNSRKIYSLLLLSLWYSIFMENKRDISLC